MTKWQTMSPEQKEAAGNRRVMKYYAKLHKDLLLLVDALQETEPTGSFVDQATVKTKQDGAIQVSYKVRPTQLIIDTGTRRFKLRLEEIPSRKD